jgi:hypothetical protein
MDKSLLRVDEFVVDKNGIILKVKDLSKISTITAQCSDGISCWILPKEIDGYRYAKQKEIKLFKEQEKHISLINKIKDFNIYSENLDIELLKTINKRLKSVIEYMLLADKDKEDYLD